MEPTLSPWRFLLAGWLPVAVEYTRQLRFCWRSLVPLAVHKLVPGHFKSLNDRCCLISPGQRHQQSRWSPAVRACGQPRGPSADFAEQPFARLNGLGGQPPAPAVRCHRCAQPSHVAQPGTCGGRSLLGHKKSAGVFPALGGSSGTSPLPDGSGLSIAAQGCCRNYAGVACYSR